jgi:hypothetical protein
MRCRCGDEERASRRHSCNNVLWGTKIARVQASIVATLPGKASTIGQLITNRRTDRIHKFPRCAVTQVYFCFLSMLNCDLQRTQGDVESALLVTVTCLIPTACASRRHCIPPESTRAKKAHTARDANPFGRSRYIMYYDILQPCANLGSR